jgi:hypothetical protein
MQLRVNGHNPRRRYTIGTRWLILLTPFFRYSASRDAYVLRIVGNHTGPVLRPAPRERSSARTAGPAVPLADSVRRPSPQNSGSRIPEAVARDANYIDENRRAGT